MVNKAQLGWLIGIVGGLIAIGTSGKVFWHDWGWITPAQAEAEHTASEDAILDAIKDLQYQQKEGHEEWKCDEYDEELQKLRRAIARAEEGTDEYIDLAYKIERIENKMQQLECSRFEDFG